MTLIKFETRKKKKTISKSERERYFKEKNDEGETKESICTAIEKMNYFYS